MWDEEVKKRRDIVQEQKPTKTLTIETLCYHPEQTLHYISLISLFVVPGWQPLCSRSVCVCMMSCFCRLFFVCHYFCVSLVVLFYTIRMHTQAHTF